MEPEITAFSWGYHGWGNATARFLSAADAVEGSRGFEPPLFVDTRISRSVRARGFNGRAFEQLVGPARYRWMNRLGNLRIVGRSDEFIKIADPSAAADLLDLVLRAADERRRVLFFCSCPDPMRDGEIACHRTTVATLLLEEARRRVTPLVVVEWPGGRPERIDVEVQPQHLRAATRGRKSLPLPDAPPLTRIAGLPWGSIASLHAAGQTAHIVTGPAFFTREAWNLPVLAACGDSPSAIADCRRHAADLRRNYGYEPRTA